LLDQIHAGEPCALIAYDRFFSPELRHASPNRSSMHSNKAATGGCSISEDRRVGGNVIGYVMRIILTYTIG